MGEVKIEKDPSNSKEEFLHINRNSKVINSRLVIVRYRDKETNQYVVYIPALDISSYGETKKKATEMLKFSLEEYFDYLVDLSQKKMEAELFSNGWSHSKIKQKEYSKAYIDVSGELKNFAVEDKVELEVLTT